MDLDDLRRQLKTGELYEPPAKPMDPDELWPFLAENANLTKDDLGKVGLSFSQIAKAFGDSVKQFGKAVQDVTDPMTTFGKSVGKVFEETEEQITRIRRAFYAERRLHPETGATAGRAVKLAAHLAEKERLDHKARELGYFEFTQGGDGCSRCGAMPEFTFPSMTEHAWDEKNGKVLCSMCGFAHVEQIEDQEAEYQAGLL